MSLPLTLATHIKTVGAPCTVRKLCQAFPDLSFKAIDSACRRAAKAGWLNLARFDKRSIAFTAGVIDEDRARFSELQWRRSQTPAIRTAPIVPEGIPVGIPASVWDLPVHGWPAERKPMNYWPAEEPAEQAPSLG